MNSLKTLLIRDRGRGTALAYVAVIGVIIVGMASFAVDYAKITLVRSELRTAVDAATLAACSQLGVTPATARTQAKTIAALNTVDNHPLILLDSDIEFGTWNATNRTFTLLTGANEINANSLRVTGQLNASRNSVVTLNFSKFFGVGTKTLASTSTGSYAAATDVVLVQDITSSFSGNLASAKTGDQALLDALKNTGGTGGFGLVAQTGKGKTIAALQKISSNYGTLKNAITSLTTCGGSGMPACSGTDIAAGIEQGITVFTGYATPSTSGKAMILVSDGESTQDSGGQHPTMNAAQLLVQAQTDANTAWNTYQIHVYVVFFNATNDPVAAAKLKTLIRGKGTFISVTDPTQLPNALVGITKNLPMQIVK